MLILPTLKSVKVSYTSLSVGYKWWQGGYVARYDYSDSDGNGIAGEWIDAWEDGNGLDDADPRAIACDESHPMLYVAYDSDNVGISRFDYSTDTLLSAITPSNGISSEPVFPGRYPL